MSIVRFGALVGLGLAVALAGCGSYPEQPHGELQTRKQNPIPVCTAQLPPARRAAGNKAAVRTLEPDQWLAIIVPTYNEERGIGPTDVDCTGHYVFANETLRGGISKSGWPRKIDPDEVEIRSGPEGLRTVWLRALTFENGDEGGLVALVRAAGDRADVFGVGSFRAPAKGTKLTPMRLGNDNLVVAETKTCPDPDDCRQRAHFYLARRGRLIEAASVDLERTAIVPSVTERGLYARYMLRTDVSYKPNGIQLLEQVRVKIVKYEDGNRDSDRELRRVEFQRFLRVERDTLFSSNDPLWERVVGQD
ncbi:hypothetical protein SOCE26_061890 [Sorangium cellulosum]|uniref:Uncharacterized protein n=1 Tax=Sorangium cellulosum TaxID=56 RepID=A0A2L0EZI4_SORCE|nr:hypothetical protein [Sorangium cellulosum]AUX44722.1 hypothetical protein SOCE26_061890 [Sorangium cellulosum]